MTDLKGQVGELRATIQITRATTGKVEEFVVTGRADLEELAKIPGAKCIHGACGAMVGQGSAVQTN